LGALILKGAYILVTTGKGIFLRAKEFGVTWVILLVKKTLQAFRVKA
jgi:hypothetical protein